MLAVKEGPFVIRIAAQTRINVDVSTKIQERPMSTINKDPSTPYCGVNTLHVQRLQVPLTIIMFDTASPSSPLQS